MSTKDEVTDCPSCGVSGNSDYHYAGCPEPARLRARVTELERERDNWVSLAKANADDYHASRQQVQRLREALDWADWMLHGEGFTDESETRVLIRAALADTAPAPETTGGGE